MIEINQSFKINQRRYELVSFALSFFFGIVSARMILPGIPIILGSFLLAGTIVLLNRRNKANLRAALMLLVFLIGILDYSLIFGINSKLDAYEGKPSVYECLIIDSPVEKQSYVQYTARTLSVLYEGKQYNFNEKIFLRISKETVFRFGDNLAIEGECSSITGIRNPGDFDYRLYYKSKGISKVIKADNAVLLKKDSAGIIRTMLHLSKEKIIGTINEALPEEEAAILVGIITGDKADIDEDTREAYMKAGLSHILSVSGLHVGFLMLLLTYVLMPFRFEKKLKGTIILIIITYYVLLIGAPLPSIRALIMLVVLMMGKAIGREYNLLTSVSFAGMIMLVFNPLSVHDPGFMISFGAMYSIAIIYPVLYRILKCIPSAIRGAVAFSLSVWLGLAPLLAHYFNYISIISILLNLIAVPISFVITISGFIGVLVGIVSKTLAIYIFSVDYYLIGILTYLIQKASVFPMSGFNIPALPVYIYFLYYAGIGLVIAFLNNAFFRIYIRRFTLGYLLILVVAFSAYSLPSKDLKIVFFDVGQGDSCCIITPKKRVVLIDGGGSLQKGDYYYDVGGKITLPALLHQGIWKIDTVIVSHLHEDHMEGLLAVMEVYSVKNLILPKVSAGIGNVSEKTGVLLDMCREKGVKVYKLGKGDYINLGGGIRMDFLLPGEEAKPDENENSLVGMLIFENFQALFTGDIGKETEKLLPIEVIRSSVLKVPHHGSGGASSEEFLIEIKPRVSVISVGKNNFGHPSAEVLERLSNSGSLVYRTDDNGAVTITTDGKSMKVKTVKQ